MSFTLATEIYFYLHLYGSYFRTNQRTNRITPKIIYAGLKSGEIDFATACNCMNLLNGHVSYLQRKYYDIVYSNINKKYFIEKLNKYEKSLIKGWKGINEYLRSFHLKDFVNDERCWSLKNINKNFENKKTDPLVSIIVPAYNTENTIENSIRSLINQTYGNLEIIIVNDGSTDNTSAVIQNLQQQDKRIKLINLNKNNGAYFARNLGVSYSKGDLITVQDSDDISHPDKIKIHVDAFEKDRALMGDISYWIRFDIKGQLVFSRGLPLLRINMSSLMVRRKVIQEIGLWENIRFGADSEFFERCRFIYGRSKIKKIPLPLSIGLFRENSLTASEETGVYSTLGLKRRSKYEEAWRRKLLRKYSPYSYKIIKYLDSYYENSINL